MRKYHFKPYIMIYDFEIELISPLKLGSGEENNTDCDVLKDANGMPLIPATSFAGVLRHYFKKNYSKNFDVNKYFGNDKDNKASEIIFSDFLVKENTFEIFFRDGIRIDNETGITADKAKFDFEVIDAGATFKSKIRFISDDKDDILSFIKTLDRDLKLERISLGGKTNLGFGKIKLLKSNVNFYDLNNKQDVIKWLSKEDNQIDLDKITPFELKNDDFVVELDFFIKDSLIVKSYPIDRDDVDAMHIKANDNYVIPGTSLKGAIRARTERILNTLNLSNRKKFFQYLFGDSIEKGSIPSRLQINEVLINQDMDSDIQHRIKIDRFTGGTITGALFDALPIFAKNYNKPNRMEIKIKDADDIEIGLILLILKDLFTEDLPIGGEKNIGRGVLRGNKFSIFYKDLKIENKNFSNLNEDEKKILQKYVDVLNNSDFSSHIKKYDETYREVLK